MKVGLDVKLIRGVVGSNRHPKADLGPTDGPAKLHVSPTESPPMKRLWLRARTRNPGAASGAWLRTRSHTPGASEQPLAVGEGTLVPDGMRGQGGEAGEVGEGKVQIEGTGAGDVGGTPGGGGGEDIALSLEEEEQTKRIQQRFQIRVTIHPFNWRHRLRKRDQISYFSQEVYLPHYRQG